MTVKLVLLKSGEDIIANVNEIYTSDSDVISSDKIDSDKNKLIAYLFKRPCSVKLRSFTPEADGKNGFQIGLNSWIPLTKDESILVPLDWVVTMTTPIDKLMEMYMTEVVNNEDNNDKNTKFN